MGKADDEYPEDYVDNEDTITLIITSGTTPSSDEYDAEKLETIETTSIKQVTKHHGSSHSNPDVDYYDEHETEEEVDNPTQPIKTTSSSSLSPMKFLTNSITETTTTEIPFTYPIWSLSNSNIQVSSTTIDPEKKAAFLAKTSNKLSLKKKHVPYLSIQDRDRFYLKIFAISITVGMIILAGILITIHLVRKGRHYHGYDLPANKQSINV
jgi:hypothetical protein